MAYAPTASMYTLSDFSLGLFTCCRQDCLTRMAASADAEIRTVQYRSYTMEDKPRSPSPVPADISQTTIDSLNTSLTSLPSTDRLADTRTKLQAEIAETQQALAAKIARDEELRRQQKCWLDAELQAPNKLIVDYIESFGLNTAGAYRQDPDLLFVDERGNIYCGACTGWLEAERSFSLPSEWTQLPRQFKHLWTILTLEYLKNRSAPTLPRSPISGLESHYAWYINYFQPSYEAELRYQTFITANLDFDTGRRSRWLSLESFFVETRNNLLLRTNFIVQLNRILFGNTQVTNVAVLVNAVNEKVTDLIRWYLQANHNLEATRARYETESATRRAEYEAAVKKLDAQLQQTLTEYQARTKAVETTTLFNTTTLLEALKSISHPPLTLGDVMEQQMSEGRANANSPAPIGASTPLSMGLMHPSGRRLSSQFQPIRSAAAAAASPQDGIGHGAAAAHVGLDTGSVRAANPQLRADQFPPITPRSATISELLTQLNSESTTGLTAALLQIVQAHNNARLGEQAALIDQVNKTVSHMQKPVPLLARSTWHLAQSCFQSMRACCTPTRRPGSEDRQPLLGTYAQDDSVAVTMPLSTSERLSYVGSRDWRYDKTRWCGGMLGTHLFIIVLLTISLLMYYWHILPHLEVTAHWDK